MLLDNDAMYVLWKKIIDTSSYWHFIWILIFINWTLSSCIYYGIKFANSAKKQMFTGTTLKYISYPLELLECGHYLVVTLVVASKTIPRKSWWLETKTKERSEIYLLVTLALFSSLMWRGMRLNVFPFNNTHFLLDYSWGYNRDTDQFQGSHQKSRR